jgi:hypothetical protein
VIVGIHVKLGNWASLRDGGGTVGDRLASASVLEREFILQSRKVGKKTLPLLRRVGTRTRHYKARERMRAVV